MFLLAYKLNESVLKKLLDYVDYGKGPNYDHLEGSRSTGFIIKGPFGYTFIKGVN